MPQGYNKGEGPQDKSNTPWPEIIERDGIKLINGGVDPLHEFDWREFHGAVTGMPTGPPPPPSMPPRR